MLDTEQLSLSRIQGKRKSQYLGGTQDNGSYLTREPGINGPQEASRVGSGMDLSQLHTGRIL